MTLNQALVDYVRILVQQHGWSQRELARHLGLHQTMVSYFLRGQRRNKTLAFYERLAAIADTSVSDLFAQVEELKRLHEQFQSLERPLRSHPFNTAIDTDGRYMPMSSEQVALTMERIIAEGELLLAVFRHGGQLAVQSLGQPSWELVKCLEAAARGYRKALERAS